VVSWSISNAPFSIRYEPDHERIHKATKTGFTLGEVRPVFGAKIEKGCLTITAPDMDEAIALTKRESIAFVKWIRGKVK
jgi:hypothetical protein